MGGFSAVIPVGGTVKKMQQGCSEFTATEGAFSRGERFIVCLESKRLHRIRDKAQGRTRRMVGCYAYEPSER